MSALEESLYSALRAVYDPCSVAMSAPLSIVDMGLVTRLAVDRDGRVEIELRPTSAMCMLVAPIMEAVETQAKGVPGVSAVAVTVNWSTGWSEADLSQEGKRKLTERRERSRTEVPVEPQEWKRRGAPRGGDIVKDRRSTNLTIVREFAESWRSNDVERIASYLTDDVVWHDVMFTPLLGIDAFKRYLQAFQALYTECELVIRNVAEGEGGVVLCERTDRFKVNGRWLDMPVLSSIVVRDGKIAEWREYFDVETLETKMSECLGRPAGIAEWARSRRSAATSP